MKGRRNNLYIILLFFKHKSFLKIIGNYFQVSNFTARGRTI